MTTLQITAGPSAMSIAEGLGRARTALVGATYWLGLAAGWLRARVVTAAAGPRLRAGYAGATYWLGLAAGWARARLVTAEPRARLNAAAVGGTYWLGLAAGWARARLVTAEPRARLHAMAALVTQRPRPTAPTATDTTDAPETTGRGAGSGVPGLLARLRRRPARPGAARVARRLARAGAWLVIVAGVGAFAASIAVPAWFGLQDQRLLIVTSGSMSPFVEAGDAVVLQAIDDASQLRVGQVATFWPPGGAHLVTHRIVDLKMYAAMEPDPTTGGMVPQRDAAGEVIERPFILTKGDANATNDPDATPLSRVRGVVVGAHAHWGFVLNWASSATGRMTMLVPPLVLLAALEITDSLAERRRRPKPRPVPRPQEDGFDAYLLT